MVTLEQNDLQITPTVGMDQGTGLTTGDCAFVDAAQRMGRHFICQPYALYSEENHAAWRHLYAGMAERWQRHANEPYLRGLDALQLDWGRVPRLEDVNRFLVPLTGFRAVAVSGFLPAYLFFDCLRRREFPTTITVRDTAQSFAPWPDIFHDVIGHVPMHTDPAFADVLVRLGSCARTAVELVSEMPDKEEQARRLTSMIRAMARFFWFTVETGLMRGSDGMKVYGSALLSSPGEIDRAVNPEIVQQSPLQLEWIIHQGFLPNFYQPLLFVVDSFDHLFDLVGQLEAWMRQGKLDDVAPGEPEITPEDIQSFLESAGGA